MAIKIRVLVRSEILFNKLRKKKDALNRELELGIKKAVEIVKTQIDKVHLRGDRTSPKGAKVSVLRRRTKRLKDSISSRIEHDKDGPIGIIGTSLHYAFTQHKGATITPTTGSFLTIPLPPAETRAGVARFTARELKDDPARAGYLGSFVARSKAGNLLIFGKKKGSITPLFKLVDEVTIPSRPFMTEALNEKRKEVRAILFTAMKKAIES